MRIELHDGDNCLYTLPNIDAFVGWGVDELGGQLEELAEVIRLYAKAAELSPVIVGAVNATQDAVDMIMKARKETTDPLDWGSTLDAMLEDAMDEAMSELSRGHDRAMLTWTATKAEVTRIR